MAQLHELLAVEGDLKGEKEKIRDEAIHTFSKKPAHFLGLLKKLEMYSDSRKNEEGEERLELVTTVKDKLAYLSTSFIRFWDAKLQKESANQRAKADIIVDEKVFLKDVPVTFLLAMEEELKQLRKVYSSIPTLAPGFSWVKDDALGKDIYKNEHVVIKQKTEKTVAHKILVPASKEHPAQVEKWTEDKAIGRYVTEDWSGMISSTEKSILLGKVDNILRAIKKARQRANNEEITKIEVGKVIFDYINS